MPTSLAAQWAALEEHFQRHTKLVARFRKTGRDAVVSMWENQINENLNRTLANTQYRMVGVSTTVEGLVVDVVVTQ